MHEKIRLALKMYVVTTACEVSSTNVWGTSSDMKIVPKFKKIKTAQDNRYFKRKKETNSNTSMYHQ